MQSTKFAILMAATAVVAFTFCGVVVESAMLRTITLAPLSCETKKCEGSTDICTEHLNITTGCFQKLCVPYIGNTTTSNSTTHTNKTNSASSSAQKHVPRTQYECKSLICTQGYECRKCKKETFGCNAHGLQCIMNKVKDCASLSCDDDERCKKVSPVAVAGKYCRGNLTETTHECVSK